METLHPARLRAHLKGGLEPLEVIRCDKHFITEAIGYAPQPGGQPGQGGGGHGE